MPQLLLLFNIKEAIVAIEIWQEQIIKPIAEGVWINDDWCQEGLLDPDHYKVFGSISENSKYIGGIFEPQGGPNWLMIQSKTFFANYFKCHVKLQPTSRNL